MITKINTPNYFAIGTINFCVVWDKKRVGKYRLTLSYKNHFVGLFKKNNLLLRLKYFILNVLFIIHEETDCDGFSCDVKDRLTNGRIYNYRRWHFVDYASDGTFHEYGMTKRILGKDITK